MDPSRCDRHSRWPSALVRTGLLEAGRPDRSRRCWARLECCRLEARELPGSTLGLLASSLIWGSASWIIGRDEADAPLLIGRPLAPSASSLSLAGSPATGALDPLITTALLTLPESAVARLSDQPVRVASVGNAVPRTAQPAAGAHLTGDDFDFGQFAGLFDQLGSPSSAPARFSPSANDSDSHNSLGPAAIGGDATSAGVPATLVRANPPTPSRSRLAQARRPWRLPSITCSRSIHRWATPRGCTCTARQA
jgi:hypothetical protein